MPYPNEHAARLEDPDKYVRFRRDNNEFGRGIHAIWGIRDDGGVDLQSIRFDSDVFTPEEAKAWLERYGYEATLEPATGKGEDKDGD